MTRTIGKQVGVYVWRFRLTSVMDGTMLWGTFNTHGKGENHVTFTKHSFRNERTWIQ